MSTLHPTRSGTLLSPSSRAPSLNIAPCRRVSVCMRSTTLRPGEFAFLPLAGGRLRGRRPTASGDRHSRRLRRILGSCWDHSLSPVPPSHDLLEQVSTEARNPPRLLVGGCPAPAVLLSPSLALRYVFLVLIVNPRDDPNIDETTRLRNRIAELESLVRELRGTSIHHMTCPYWD